MRQLALRRLIEGHAPHPSPLPVGEGAGCGLCNSVPSPMAERDRVAGELAESAGEEAPKSR